MDNFPITFALWILFVLLVIIRKICIGRRRAVRARDYAAETGGEIYGSESPSERRRKIEETLITRKVVTRGEDDEGDWWSSFRNLGGRPIQFSEQPASSTPPELAPEQAPTNDEGLSDVDLEEGRAEQARDEPNEETGSPTDETRNNTQTSSVLHTISMSLRSVTEPGQRTSCDICLAEYEVGEEVSWSPNEECTHAFHKECITDWLMTHPSCPCCRRNYLAPGTPVSDEVIDTPAYTPVTRVATTVQS